jgi:hypothetical protein
MRNNLLSKNASEDLSNEILCLQSTQLVFDFIKKNATEFIDIHLIVYAEHGLIV